MTWLDRVKNARDIASAIQRNGSDPNLISLAQIIGDLCDALEEVGTANPRKVWSRMAQTQRQ